MLGQLSFAPDGQLRDKVQAAIDRLRCFEPEEGYYVAFSGGKDSQCIYHLCQMAGVRFDAHYAVTSVDPPELVQFIKEHYPDAWEGRHKSGETMWSLIRKKKLPPTQLQRYCCESLKETGGDGRVTVTGVRWAESVRRSRVQGVVLLYDGKRKQTLAEVEKQTNNYIMTKSGGIILNDDNDENRRVVESCYRTSKTLVNPIVDWDDGDVWDFLEQQGVPHCALYDEGFSRLGCIGCPMAGGKQMRKEFERWPKYKELYLKAFEKMLQSRRDAGLETTWETAQEVMEWWIR